MANDGFGLGEGICLWRYRVHFRGVDKVNALRHRIIELLESFGMGVLVAVGHRT